jgi:hypothetical protein
MSDDLDLHDYGHHLVDEMLSKRMTRRDVLRRATRQHAAAGARHQLEAQRLTWLAKKARAPASSTSAQVTLAPKAAKPSALAAPMPLPAPTTTARRPPSSNNAR